MLSEYPGRGLIYHTDPKGDASWVYFITARSDASKARRLRVDRDCLVVAPSDDSAASDELRHYACARWTDGTLVVGNGDHVDVIVRGLERRQPLDQIVSSLEPEPDPPIWTPRIALVMEERAHFVSVSRSATGTVRRVQEVPRTAGVACVLTTYSGTARDPHGDAPYAELNEQRSTRALCEELFWGHLDERYRVLLVAGPVKSVDNAPRVELSFEVTLGFHPGNTTYVPETSTESGQ